MRKNKVLVIIVAYNSMKWAQKCYDSLQKSTIACDVITIDNGSSDGTQSFIRNHYPDVTLIEEKENLGFGKANNLGLQKMLDEGYEYAYLLNQDAWVDSNTFELLINAFENNPSFGILSPMQMQSDLCHQDTKFNQLLIKNYPHFSDCNNEDSNLVLDIPFVMAAHWMLNRKCVEQVGGFSPTFFLYGEDNNYIDRVHYWGFNVGIVPQSHAVHDRSDSNWNEQKYHYIYYYTMILSKCSNPKNPASLFQNIKSNIATALVNKNWDIFKYAIRLMKQYRELNKNYRRSLHPKAFLE